MGIAKELTVGEVAARSGVSVSALHFYERKGLIKSYRTAGNQRRYARDVLRRVAIIHMAQQLGLSLATVGKALSTLPEGKTPSRDDWARLSQGWAGDLERRILQLQRLQHDLTNCIGCGCLSIDRCALLNSEDALAAKGPGPVLILQAGIATE